MSGAGGVGGVGGEEKFGCQQEEEGSKRRMRIDVCGVPVEAGPGGAGGGGEGDTHKVWTDHATVTIDCRIPKIPYSL